MLGCSLIFAVVFVWATVATAQSSGSSKIVGYCYDEKRGHVFRMKSDQCQGRIVDEDEAERIRDARANRLKAILGKQKVDPFPGMRRQSHGTGFFVSAQGHLLTNNHVIDGCRGVTVETTTGETWKAQVLSALKSYDLGLLKVAEQPTGVAEFRANSNLHHDARTDLLGYPTQGIAPIIPIFTPANLTTKEGLPNQGGRFSIRGDVRGGNSGGPVLDDSGRVVGVIFAQLNLPAIYQKTGREYDDTGIAVSNEVVLPFLLQNGVKPKISNAVGGGLSRETVFDRSRPLVARIGCWK